MAYEMRCKQYEPDSDQTCKHYEPTKDDSKCGVCLIEGMFLCVEDVRFKMPTITQSALKMFAQCPEKYKKHYIDGTVLKDAYLPAPVKMGTLFDGFITSVANGEKFNPQDTIERYEMSEVCVAKVEAMCRAYRHLGLKPSKGTPQAHFNVDLNGFNIEGTADMDCGQYGEEYKFSGRPNFFEDKSINEFQTMMYMFGFTNWNYIVYKVVRAPGLKFRGGWNLKDETISEYTKRIFADIIGRPAWYFLGWNKKEKDFGIKFYRAEFDMKNFKRTVLNMIHMIRYMVAQDRWFPDTLSCMVPTMCWYMNIKKTGVISDKTYRCMDIHDQNRGLL